MKKLWLLFVFVRRHPPDTMQMKHPLKFVLAASLLCFLTVAAFGDVTWRGTGTVSSSGNSLIQTDVGDRVEWSIEYEEASLEEDFDDRALRMSIRFTFPNSQTIQLDSKHKKISGFGERLVNWSLTGSDDLSYTAFPAGSLRTTMTMRLTADDVVDEQTYFALRNPSFGSPDRFFGYVDTGVGAALFFEVDIASLEIFEHSDDGPLAISLPEPGQVDLSWPVSSDGLYRVEVSSDLRVFFNLHEELHTQPAGVFSEHNLTAETRFYRLLRLRKIFPE